MKIHVGKKYLHHTFAGVDVVSLVTEKLEDCIFMGHLIRKKDVSALKKAGVPYKGLEDPASCEGVMYQFQVIRKLK